jgi:large subunit ribosomal protein L14
MIQKGSYLLCSDKNGALLVGVFHLYRGFYKKYSVFGGFLKISIKKTTASFLVLKKSKFKAILILTRKNQKKNDGSFLKFKANSCVLLKRRLSPLGKEISGPANFNIFRRRFSFSFAVLI